jgi:hypothetical protein
MEKILKWNKVNTNKNTFYYTAANDNTSYTIAEYEGLGFMVFINQSHQNLNKKAFPTIDECKNIAESHAKSLIRLKR